MKKVHKLFLAALTLMVGAQALSVSAANVVETAVEVPELSTLVSLIQQADLVDALVEAENVTVFAPTNEAFEKVPAGILQRLASDKELLRQVLLYHVSPERLRAEDVVSMSSINTLQGQHLTVKLENGNVYVDNAKVIATDIETDNATVHLIDAVMIPEGLLERADRHVVAQRVLRDLSQRLERISILLNDISSRLMMLRMSH
jgi:uncharacterized surface protein with fasciclin (FAS1) repeats